MALNDILNILQIGGTFAVIYGIWLGLKQLKLDRDQRRDLAVMECARSFEDKEFTEAYGLITTLGPDQTKKQITDQGEEYELAALRVGMKFETIGFLIYKKVVPIDAMEDLVGGAALTIWEILNKWVIETRTARNHPNFMEWYEWLIDRLMERNRGKRQPAYLAHKNWKSDY